MAYIGRDTDKLSNIEVLDVITFDGSSSYTLQKNSVNFTPSSANNVLVSIDGVVQANNFTVSGSTIDFGVAVPSTSTCDWIYHIGVGLITTPADGTVGISQLSATGTKDATTYLRGDNTFATVTSGLTEADQWRITADATSSGDITANWERVDTSGQGTLGTGMTESSGIFTFPSTGIWEVEFAGQHYLSADRRDPWQYIKYSSDGGSNFSDVAAAASFIQYTASGVTYAVSIAKTLLDITNISNDQVKFNWFGTTSLLGSTSINYTYVTFKKLGET